MIKIGPPGIKTDLARVETYGEVWDDGGRDKVVQIFIAHDQDSIISLQLLYDENGNLVLSDKHGGDIGAPNLDVVTLNYPSEYITGIRGCYNREVTRSRKGKTLYCHDRVISITFITYYRTYGPFGGGGTKQDEGVADDSIFQYQLGPNRQFAGLHGRAGKILHALGVYAKPLTALSNVKVKVENEIA